MERRVIYCQDCKIKVSRTVFYRSHFKEKCKLQKKVKLRPTSTTTNNVVFNDIHMEDESNQQDMFISHLDDDMAIDGNSESEVEDKAEEDVEEEDEEEDEEGQGEDEVWNCDELPDFFQEEDVNTTDPSCETRNSKLVFMLKALLKWQNKYSLTDACILSLLRIIKLVLITVNAVVKSQFLETFTEEIPDTLYSARKLVQLERDDFCQYVVCQKCCTIYKKDATIVEKMGRKTPKRCSHIPFKNHPQRKFRSPCNTDLLKTIFNSSGDKETFYPKKVYCYRGIKKTMQDLINRDGFLELLFTEPTTSETFISDIYDGLWYKEFKGSDGSPYFSEKRNVGLIVNFDFFNPFKNSKYSLGVLYAVITNLPRKVRFLWENILTLAIIPGPEEPKKHINSFLEPLIDELLECWSPGIKLVETDGVSALYHFAVVCLSCDLPAIRKCGGFLSHNARKGCSKCLCDFIFDENRHLGGFDSGSWTKRNGMDHKETGFTLLSCRTLDERSTLEKQTGVRYSEFFRLPYYDPVRNHVVDPMHNIFLGISKHVFKTWIETKSIKEEQFGLINERQAKLKIPSDLGRITACVTGNYKCMKADEWKHWVMVYSMYCLKGILPQRDLNIWALFVNGCHLVCRPVVTKDDVSKAHKLFEFFGSQFETQYGSQYLVPNLHMLLHLKECIDDFGPVYSFWCFGFERYNGILGAFKTNGHSISVQLMRKFVCSSKLHSADVDTETSDVNQKVDVFDVVATLNIAKIDQSCFRYDFEQPKSTCKRVTFDQSTIDLILNMFKTYCGMDIRRVSPIGKRALRLGVGNQTYSCNRYRGCSPYSFVNARWHSQSTTITFRPAVIRQIYQIQATDENNEVKTYWVAEMDWFKNHTKKNYYGYNSHIKIWSNEYEPNNDSTFIPVRFIKGRFVFIKETITFEDCTDSVAICINLPFQSFL